MKTRRTESESLEILQHLSHRLEHISEILKNTMTALATLTASVAAVQATLVSIAAAVDTAVADLNNPGATDAQLLTLSAAVDSVAATITAQAARLTAATGALTLAAPVSLVATTGPGSISLAWAPVPGATGYNVKTSTVAGGPYTNLAADPIATPSVSVVLPTGVPVFFVVSAVNAAGEGPNSVEVSATPA